MAITLLDVKKFFGYPTASEFTAEWKLLSEKEQNEVKEGINNGSYSY